MRGVELKVVLPGAVGGEEGWTEEHLVAMEESGDFHYLYVQPQDPVDPSAVEQSHLKGGSWGGVEELGRARNTTAASAQYQNNVQQCIDFCMRHPRWRVSIQTHKFMNLR
jgi:organic radical activating enzyme